MKYDKSITIKVGIKEFDKIHNLASEKNEDVSSIIRKFIEDIDINEEKIREDIEFHKYHINILENKLEKIQQKTKNDELKNEEKIKKLQEEKLKKRVKKITNPILSKIAKYGEIFVEGSKEEIDIAKARIIKTIKDELKNIHNDDKERVIETLSYYINKWYFNLKKKTNFGLIFMIRRGNTWW